MPTEVETEIYIKDLEKEIEQHKHLFKTMVKYIENSLKDPKTDERLILQVVLAKLKVELEKK